MGASWLSGADRNPFERAARKRGFTLVSHTDAATDLFRADGSRASAQDHADFKRDARAIQRAIHKAGKGGQDVPASQVIPTGLPWGGAVQSWLGPMDYGTEFDAISTRDDWLSASDQPSYFVGEGLGAVVASKARGVPLRLSTTAHHVDWSGNGVRVETYQGRIAARACIVTVSTGVLVGRGAAVHARAAGGQTGGRAGAAHGTAGEGSDAV